MIHRLKRLWFWLSWPGLWLYFNRSRRTRVLIYDGPAVLLVQGLWRRWYDREAFGLPGGGIKKGETPESALVRELSEELGITVSSAKLQSLGDWVVRESGLRYHGYFFTLQLSQTTPLTIEHRELAAVRWVDPKGLVSITLKPEARQALAARADR